ncbi:mucin-5B-like [Pyxicephalus adspersus]|uniref:mucin-5B-like n=1 Tax=Pyxicephalus adspersus TaxID=30357 RepID=UPI003B5A8656
MGTMGPAIWILTALALTHSLDIPTRVMNPAHNGLVCSTWGNFHYKTFDGDIYQFPGTCNYVFASNCKETYEDFNIQIRHPAGTNKTVISHVVIKIVGLVIEMKKGVIMVGGQRVTLPYSQFGVQIQYNSMYVKVSSKLGISLLWNEDDALSVTVPPKYMNSTCGLCGNMNGLTQDEFMVNNIQLTPVQFGNLQKLDGPTEQCEDFVPSASKNCSNLKKTCVRMLSDLAFSDCDLRLPKQQFIEACMSDLCTCQSSDVSCICDTMSEYSRQCAHAGGKPQNWRTNTMCEKTCPMNLKYNECGSPCADTCSNSELTMVCEEHCIDGCFCPPGTVLDDVDNQGCIPLSECSCTYNNRKFAPGEFYTTSCRNCTCQGGQWSCMALPCAGHCSLQGGSHIYTYDGGHYNFHGDCSYIFTKDCVRNMFTVLTELRKCGVTDTETCLKSITLSLDKGLTVLTVKSSGTMFLNGIYARAPLVTENLAVLQPSSFFLVIQSFNGIQIQVQLIPVMQISVSLDPEYQGDACGLCGDFNNIRTDDFKSLSGAVEGTAAAFANTWKSQADCRDMRNSYENPCAVSVDNERFAKYWCSHLSDTNGPFAPCHAAVNPTVYEKNCMYDSCNYEKSEDSVCAALSAYALACAAEGVTLFGWRGPICEKYTKNCPKNSTYQYSISTCQKSCQSLSEPDPSCSIHFSPLDGCACPDGTFLDDNGACVPAKSCPCYYKGSVMPPGEVIYNNGAMCTCQSGRLHCVGKIPNVAECPANMVYFNCANASLGAHGAECQKTCQTLHMECVDPTPYHEACVRDTCGCDSGGDCECYCTAVSAYATACSDAGICISWRTPEICPMFCDYYNPEGECEWHYKPCGAPCLKTCRNPSGQCMNKLPGLEGCYPKCPKERPFFDEDIMKCVAQANCGCYDDDDKRYNVGDMVPSYKNCESCICTKKGRRCQVDLRACYCYYGNMKFNYGDIIYNTTDGIGGCITATCSSNGTINRDVYPCSPTTNAPSTTFHFDTTAEHTANMSNPEQVSPTPVSCLEEVCKWSTWYDVTCPKYGENEGDFETFENIRKNGHTICKIPSQVECRAQKFPKIPTADLGQIIQCNTSVGLVCYNRDQFSQLCFNYEIRVLCCSYVPCGESTNPPTSNTIVSSTFMNVTFESTRASTTQTKGSVSTAPSHPTQDFSSTKAPAMTTKMANPTSKKPYQTTSKSQETIFSTPCKKQHCSWTPWYDVHFPSIVKSDGDFETLENIRAAGNNICQKPEDIECRAERFPNKNITEVGQVVTCNITHGLICNNKDQDWNFPLCYNYKVRVLCCSMENCESSTTYVHSTIMDHTTEHLKKTTVGISASSTVQATSKPSTTRTDRTGQATGTLFQTNSVSSTSHKTTARETSGSYISVSTTSSPLPSMSTSKTTMTHIPTVKTSTQIKATGKPFESLVTSKYVSETTSSSKRQDSTSPSETQPKSTGVAATTAEKNTISTVESGEVTSALKSTPSKPITTKATSYKVSTALYKSTTESESKESTSHGPVSIKTTEMSTESSEVTSALKSTSSKPITTKATSNKVSTASFKSTSESEHIESTSHEPVFIKTTKVSTESGEVTSALKSTPSKPITSKATSNKVSTASFRSTSESEHIESTSHGPVFIKTTKMNTESGEVTSSLKSTPSKPITTKATSYKVSTASYKSTTESENKESTSHGPVSIKTTKMSTESGEVTSALKSTSSKPITTKATSNKVSTASFKSTSESEHKESTSHGPVFIKTTKMSTESGEETSAFKSTPSKPITTKATSYKVSTTSYKSTTDSENKESTSYGPISIKTTKMSTESGEVTSSLKSTPSKPITSKATSNKASTAPFKSTTESDQQESTSNGPVSVKTTKMSSESGEVTSALKSTPNKPITTKATSNKVSTASYKFTTESENKEPTSHGPVSIKTTKMSTESGEVTSALKSTSSKPITTKATSNKVSTASYKSTTESENKESTSHGSVSFKTTKISTESGEVTSALRSTLSKPITTKASSNKVSTASFKSTSESEQIESTSYGPVSVKTTKMSTESGEVTSGLKSTTSKPLTTKATSNKVSTASYKSTSESEHDESTSFGLISIKTTKMSTESGEVTSVLKSTSSNPITTKATSNKVSTASYKPTTESEDKESTSFGPVSIKTTKMSTESGEVTFALKSTSSKPVTTKTTSYKASTGPFKSTTESEHQEPTSHRPVSIYTTKMSTESGEVTFAPKSTSSKPVTTKATSNKVSTASFTSITDSEHKEYTSHGLVSFKTTKMSTKSDEVTSALKSTSSKPISTKATSYKVSTASTTESEHKESTSHGSASVKATKMSTESGEVTFAHETSRKPISIKPSASSFSTELLRSSTDHSTSHGPISFKTTTTFTESGAVGSTLGSITNKETSSRSSSAFHTVTEGTSRDKFSSQPPKSTKQSTSSTFESFSTESTVTQTARPITATTESFSTTRCMCNFNGTIVSPGNILYNTTDKDGWCFYARCNEKCQVERYSELCSTVPTVPSSTKTGKTVTASTATTITAKTGSTTQTFATSTKTAQTKTSASSVSSASTPTPGCSAVMPPRMVNETWMIDQCTHATCIGGNNIVVNKKQCAPVKEVSCANRLQPRKTFDESGCCYQKECECVCGGWGVSHYITFDGTYYDFNGQCTYILVQEITPVFDHFRVYIDNFSCDPDDPSCVKTLRIMYRNDTIVLTSQSLNKRVTNKIYVNNQMVYPAVYKNGITITSSGIFVVVEIPEIGAYISFNVLSFNVRLPISKFSGNTEGHCGKCSNSQVDDCILPNGQLASSCTEMAGQWKVPSQDSSSCNSIPTRAPTISSWSTLPYSSLSSTYFSTLKSSVPQTLPTIVPSKEVSLLPSVFSTAVQTTEKPCNTPEVCKVILSNVFKECHTVVPPEPFYQACVSDGCTRSEGDVLCSSLQSYARLCGIEGVCVDWRDSTNGLCSKNCSSHLEYRPCGPAVEPTCNSRYNDKFYNKSTDFMEGCYCPKGTTKFNTISDKCVKTCGCTGPDGMPREPGETWESNCQTCICDNTTMSVRCAAKSCAMPIPASCTEEGSMPVSLLDPANPCCHITECRCNISLCSKVKIVCELGYEAVLQTETRGCCPLYKCVPKDVCVYNGSQYQPGDIVPSSNPCEKCMCDGTMNETSKMHPVTCTPIVCSIKCAQGFTYQNVAGQCCGTCVQSQCVMDLPDNSTYLLNPGKTWSPPGDNCTEYECVNKKGKLLTVASKMSCPKINLDECVPGTIQKDSKGCCLTCVQERNKCQKMKTEEIILQNGCRSLKPVVMSFCKGNCESSSRYSAKSQSMEHICGCCQETETERVTVDLSCPNGEIMNYSFISVKSCACADSTCHKERKEGDEKVPHVTHSMPQTTVKARITTKSTEQKGTQSQSHEKEKPEENASKEKQKVKPIFQTIDKLVTKVKKIVNNTDLAAENSDESTESRGVGKHENNSEEKESNKNSQDISKIISQPDKNTQSEDSNLGVKPFTKEKPQSTEKVLNTSKQSTTTPKKINLLGLGK